MSRQVAYGLRWPALPLRLDWVAIFGPASRGNWPPRRHLPRPVCVRRWGSARSTHGGRLGSPPFARVEREDLAAREDRRDLWRDLSGGRLAAVHARLYGDLADHRAGGAGGVCAGAWARGGDVSGAGVKRL